MASDLIVPFEDTGGKLDALPVMSKPEGPSYSYKYLFDGGCSVCTSVVAMLKSRKGHENIYFEDISLPSFKPAKVQGLTIPCSCVETSRGASPILGSARDVQGRRPGSGITRLSRGEPRRRE